MEPEILIILGIAIMLMMALSVVFFVFLYQKRSIRHQLEVKILQEQKQLELLQASIQSEEEERMRIAGELHDDVGATLSSIRLFLHKAAEDAPQAALIAKSRDLLDDSIKTIRNISHKLQPAILQSLGLYASLQAYAETFNQSQTIHIKIHADAQLPRLDNHTELHIYRILQELITNCLKYSNATQLTITLNKRFDELLVVLMHNGQGIGAGEYEALLNKKGAIGLKNIANRIKFITGKIAFEQGTDLLYRITITVPLQPKTPLV